jgi:ADP-heptose:LPS heptosyltransferase
MSASLPHALVVRLDNAGDVLLTGPAVRAVRAGARRLTFVAGPRGTEAAKLLEGVDDVVTFGAPWIDASTGPVDAAATARFVDDLRARKVDQAFVFTSFHQSPLPRRCS